MHQKGFIKIIVVILIILLAAAGYLYLKNSEVITNIFQKKSDETAGWKTYRNEKYGYSFMYPPESVVDINGIPIPGGALSQTDLPIYVSNPEEPGVALFNLEFDGPSFLSGSRFHSEYTKLSLEGFAKKIWQANKDSKNPNFPNKKISDITRTKVAGKNAYQFTLDSVFDIEGNGYILDIPHKYLFIENAGHKFMISIPLDEFDSEKILNTLRFIK
ncbi:MAG: hypothetical protein AAB642_02765 [Patescibacteria group bacterium]